MSGVILVSERMNQATWRSRCWPDVACGHYWQVMTRLGAFRDGRSREKLRSLELAWDLVVNFLPSDPQGVPWDTRGAREAARTWLLRLAEFNLVLLVGRRIVDAFGVELLRLMEECCGSEVDLGGVAGLVVPHLSGLNRFWNDVQNAKKFKERH